MPNQTNEVFIDKANDGMVGYKTHLIDYDYNGMRWEMKILAEDPSDAIARLRAAAMGGEYVGELTAELPGWLPRWMAMSIFWILDKCRGSR